MRVLFPALAHRRHQVLSVRFPRCYKHAFSFVITAPLPEALLWLQDCDMIMAILALLNRECLQGFCVITRRCSGGAIPDLGGNFTGLAGVPLPLLARHHGQVSHVTLSKVAPAPRNPPFGCTQTSGAAKNVHDLPKAHIPPDLP